jgi:hypothetical protein
VVRPTRRTCNSHVGTEHILLGLLIEDEGIAAPVLEDRGANLATVREQLSRMSANGQAEAISEGRWQGGPVHLPRRPGGEHEPGDRGATMLGEVISRAFGWPASDTRRSAWSEWVGDREHPRWAGPTSPP